MLSRKMLLLIAVLATGLVILSACTGAAQPTQSPATEAPASPPATAPTEAVTPALTEAGSLTANPWQWVAFTNPVEQYTIDDPQSYTLTFNEDGTLIIKADCNNALGSYTLDGSSIQIVLGPMTLAACPEGSRSDEFIKHLGFAAIYFFQDGNLYIDLFADGGTMEFAPVDETASASSLTTNPWQWVAFTNPVEQYALDNPQDYTLTFNKDSTLNIKADCNIVLGSYTLDGSSIQIVMGPMTLVACPEGSRSDEFTQHLGSAAIYFFQDGNLYIDLFADSGTMQFAPADEAAGVGAPQAVDMDALVQTLGNLSYSGILPDQPATLTDGVFNYEDGSSAKPYIRLIGHGTVMGDLDGDGTQDAVVLLEDNTSGTGRFVYAAAVLDALGNATPNEAWMLGDRIEVKSLAIEGSQVVADLVAQGPGDAACCATWNVRQNLTLASGRLAEHSREEQRRISLADLNGTNWRLVDLNSLNKEPPLHGTQITLQIVDDQLSGFAGCNNYNTTVSSQVDNPHAFVVEPIATSNMACPQPIMDQEATYLSRLEKADSWWYDTGRLALTYDLGDGNFGNLVFESITGASDK